MCPTPINICSRRYLTPNVTGTGKLDFSFPWNVFNTVDKNFVKIFPYPSLQKGRKDPFLTSLPVIMVDSK